MNEKRGPKTRVYNTRVWRLYGSGYIQMNRLEEHIIENGGDIVLRVVRDEKEKGVTDLVYGVFYQAQNGEYFDVISARNSMLKKFSGAGSAAGYISGFAEKCGDRFLSFELPALNENLCIEPGQLRDEFIKMRMKD